MKRKLFLFLLIGLAFSLSGIQPTPATALIIPLDFEYSGGTSPVGPDPWLTATFENIGVTGTVQLTLAANLTNVEFISDEFISEVYFNFDPVLDASLLDFEATNDSDVNSVWAATGENNDFKAGPDGKFDILFEFSHANNVVGDRFENSDKLVFLLSSEDFAVFETSFDFESQKQNAPDDKGPFRSAAHVQGIGPNSNLSGWIADNPNPVPVPEPATMLLVGMGLIGLAGFGLRRFKA